MSDGNNNNNTCEKSKKPKLVLQVTTSNPTDTQDILQDFLPVLQPFYPILDLGVACRKKVAECETLTVSQRKSVHHHLLVTAVYDSPYHLVSKRSGDQRYSSLFIILRRIEVNWYKCSSA